jgi:hypothetical protein
LRFLGVELDARQIAARHGRGERAAVVHLGRHVAVVAREMAKEWVK